MDPLRFAIAFVPLSAWLAVIAMLNMRTRPFVTTGASDILAMGLALTGLVFVGPIALFRPEPATIQFGNYVWIILLAFYWLCVALAAMTLRPRLIVYNATPEQLRPIVAESAASVDSDFRWAGDTLVLPNLGVQLHIDSFRLLRNTSLAASGANQNLHGWAILAKDLRMRIGQVRTRRLTWAVTMMTVAILLTTSSVFRLLDDPPAVAEAQKDIWAFAPE